MTLRKLILLVALVSLLDIGFATAQKIKTYDFRQIEPQFHFQNDTTYVINFWAMWCKPCVEELPEFENIRKAYSDKKVKVLLISLDFGSNVDKRLVKFLEKKQIGAETIILDDPDANSWINKVSSDWDGALPATIVYKQEKRKYFGRKVTYSELAETIDQINNIKTVNK